MRKKIATIVLIVLACGIVTRAQTEQSIVSIHPQIGNIIDSTEKRVFNLFPDYRNDVYVAARVLKNEDGSMVLRIETALNKSVEREIKEDELQKIRTQIDNSKWDYAGDNTSKDNEQKKKKNNEKETTTRSPEMDLFWARVIFYGLIIMIDILSSR